MDSGLITRVTETFANGILVTRVTETFTSVTKKTVARKKYRWVAKPKGISKLDMELSARQSFGPMYQDPEIKLQLDKEMDDYWARDPRRVANTK